MKFTVIPCSLIVSKCALRSKQQECHRDVFPCHELFVFHMHGFLVAKVNLVTAIDEAGLNIKVSSYYISLQIMAVLIQ